MQLHCLAQPVLAGARRRIRGLPENQRATSRILLVSKACLLQTWILLELVARPQCPVIEVAGWLTLLNEFPRVENSVVGLKPEVTIRLPAHLRAWTMPDETGVALSCWNNQKSGDGIHSVT